MQNECDKTWIKKYYLARDFVLGLWLLDEGLTELEFNSWQRLSSSLEHAVQVDGVFTVCFCNVIVILRPTK